MSSATRNSAAALGAALSLVGCGYQPTITTPRLPQMVPIEKTMSCPQIDLAIDRADTVRWVIREDGGRLETTQQRANREAGQALLSPLILIGAGVRVSDGGSALLNSADERIRQLLRLKREHGCTPRETTFAGKDDATVSMELEAIQSDLDSFRGDEATLFAERTRLLDGLRVVPPATTLP